MADRFLWLVIFILFIVVGGSIPARADFPTREDNKFHVLRYDDLMRLPLKARAQYIRSLRLFMVAEEEHSPGAMAELQKKSPSIAWLLMDEAEATPSGVFHKTNEECPFAGNFTFYKASDTGKLCAIDYIDPHAKELSDACTKTSGHRQIACNEFLFGLDTSGKPHCVDINTPEVAKSATRECDRTNCDKSEFCPSAEEVARDFGKHLPPGKTLADFKKEWNAYATRVKTHCLNKNNYECGKLLNRINIIEPLLAKGTNNKDICSFSMPGGSQVWLSGSVDDPNDLSKATDFGFNTTAVQADIIAKCHNERGCIEMAPKFVPLEGASVDGKFSGKTVAIRLPTEKGKPAKHGNLTLEDCKNSSNTATKCCSYALDPETPAPDTAQKNKTDAAEPCDSTDIFCSVQIVNPPECTLNPEQFAVRLGNHEDVQIGPLDDHSNLNKKIKKAQKIKLKGNDTDARLLAEDAKGEILKWGKEASTKSAKNADATVVNDDIVSQNLKTENADFNKSINDSRIAAGDCKDQWLQLKEPKPTSWTLAATTDLFACGTVSKNGKVGKIGGPYLRIHRGPNKELLRTESGTLDQDGRAINTQIFKPDNLVPYLSFHREKREQKLWGSHRQYSVDYNPCPVLQDVSKVPYYAVVNKKGGAGDGKSKYIVCSSEDGRNFKPTFTEQKDTSGGFTARDGKYVLNFGLDDESKKTKPATCAVTKNIPGGPDKVPVKIQAYQYTPASADQGAPAENSPTKTD